MDNSEQLTIADGLKDFHQRCLAVPGGIKGVAMAMGRVENTLHNWFGERTTPSLDDLSLLKSTIEQKEQEGRDLEKIRQDRLNAILQPVAA